MEDRRLNPINISRRSDLIGGTQLPESPRGPMEFLSRSWSVSAMEVSKALKGVSSSNSINSSGCLKPSGCGRSNYNSASTSCTTTCTSSIPEDINGEIEVEDHLTVENVNLNNTKFNDSSNHPFCLASSSTSQLVLERIMSQSEVSPLTSGRLSHSSGPLNGGGSLAGTDSPPVSPIDDFDDVLKYLQTHNTVQPFFNSTRTSAGGHGSGTPAGGAKTVGRWLKERKEKKNEEMRTHNAQVHAAISVAAVAASIAALAAATSASSSAKNEQTAKTDMALASAATLVAAQCVEAAESMGAERDHVASVVSSAVNVKSHDHILTLTAAAATALRGAATLKARALKEVWNIASVLPQPVEKGSTGTGVCDQENQKHSNNYNYCEERHAEDFLGACNEELLAKGTELLKRTRHGDLHWKNVSVYINKEGQVILKMKSKHAAGTITRKDKNIVIDVCKDMPAWAGRQLVDGGEHFCYFGLKTVSRGVVEFECRNQRIYEVWTRGVSRLLDVVLARKHKGDLCN